MHQQALRIDKDVALLAFDFLARVVAARVDATPPFSALFTLWLSMIAAGCQWRVLPPRTVHGYLDL